VTHRGDVERDLLAANRVRFKTPEAEEEHNLLHILSFFPFLKSISLDWYYIINSLGLNSYQNLLAFLLSDSSPSPLMISDTSTQTDLSFLFLKEVNSIYLILNFSNKRK
jgi:hypothetical protein